MSEQAGGTFEITEWDELGTQEMGEEIVFGRNRVVKVFSGGLVGGSTTEIQTVATSAGPSAYVGVEHFQGTLDGRKGSFVLQHSAGSGAEGQWLKWLIVPGSGTGELAGLRGSGQIIVGDDGAHSYTLDYDLG